MIKTNNGIIEAEGTGAELMADFSCITKALYDNLLERFTKEKSKEILTDAFNRAFLTKEELMEKSETKEKLEEILKNVLEEITNLIKDMED